MTNSIDLQLFPCIEYFKVLIKEEHIEIDAFETFKKMSFRNRYIIAGANGLVNLTIPIMGGREQKALITQIKIDNTTAWQKRHWKTLTSAYNKAPFFEFYQEEIKNLIFNPETSLFSFNVFILKKLCKLLSISTLISFTSTDTPASNENFRNKFLPKTFQQHANNWKPIYLQVFEDRLGFQSNLSILDLLFCEGPNAATLLREV